MIPENELFLSLLVILDAASELFSRFLTSTVSSYLRAGRLIVAFGSQGSFSISRTNILHSTHVRVSEYIRQTKKHLIKSVREDLPA